MAPYYALLAQAEAQSIVGTLLPWIILVAIIAAAYLSGRFVTKTLRLPDTGWKVSLIVAVVGFAVWILATNWPPKQGIDLKGGVILIYQVDENLTRQAANRQRQDQQDGDAAEAIEVGDVDMPGLVQALSRRINPGGVQEIVVRPYGRKQVEIIIPDVSGPEVDDIKKLITTGGFLKFQIVANRRDHSHIWALADEPDQVGQYQVRDEAGNVVGQWVKLSLNPQAGPDESPYREDPPQAKSRIVRGRKEILVVVDPNFDMQGSHLASVRKGYQGVNPAVFFDTTVRGASIMGALTASNLPDQTSGHYSLLGIVMDGELISAPRINSTITSHGLIEGTFTDAEVDLLVNVLRAGRLPAVLEQEPISQNEISPLLGSETIRQGRIAILISLVAVLVFMLVYYHFAGLISCLALLLNLTLILALMIFVGAAFSLPGMAALVLTVGMSVDANVLIFERIREELKSGAALRMAIRNGFQRATRTIVDANVTTLITAIVLYLIGTEQLRAFAVALILGILMTLFTGIFCSRVVFELADRTGWLKRLTMLHLPSTDWDLFTKRRIAVTFSAILIVAGILAVAARGNRIFDIDFSGGTSVQMLLKEPMPMADVRDRVERLRSEGIVENVSVTEVKSEAVGNNRIYRVDTSLLSLASGQPADDEQITSAIGTVQAALIREFRDEQGESMLQARSLSFTPPTAITAESSNVEDPTDSDDTDLPSLDPDSGAAEIDATPTEPLDAPDDNSSSQVTPTSIDGQATGEFPAGELLAQADNVSDSLLSRDPSTVDVGPMVIDDSSSLRSRAKLQFSETINAETLEDLIKETAHELGMVEPDVRLESPDATFVEGSNRGHREWDLQMSCRPDQMAQILETLDTRMENMPVWPSASQIGSSVAGDKTRLAIAAVLGSLIGIIAYIWIRFQHVTYGLAAVVALVHDVLITLGALAASYWLKDHLGFLMIDEFKISLPVVAAFLTIIGYSLNDTIVVFDRIREVKGKSPQLTPDIINTSINQTLSRTVLTSLTTLLAVVILYVMGGQGIHAFAFALIVGVIAGTYSSIFVASPSLLWMSGNSVAAKREVPEKATA